MPSEDPLELLRTRSGLSIDDEGRFLHRGEAITHARTLEILWRSLERMPDGRYLVRIGRESAYVAVVETPWVVTGVIERQGDEAPELLLSGGSREPLDPATLAVGGDGVLRCTVSGRRRARFGRAAQVALGFSLEEDPPGSGALVLTVRGVRWPVRTSPCPPCTPGDIL